METKRGKGKRNAKREEISDTNKGQLIPTRDSKGREKGNVRYGTLSLTKICKMILLNYFLHEIYTLTSKESHSNFL